MAMALKHAGVGIDQVGYLNAHATSTPLGDPVELVALEQLLTHPRPRLLVSATKSSTGHLLGAAGAVEAIFTIQALRQSVVPPTLNLTDPDCSSLAELVGPEPQEHKVAYAMSNSFGFGGTNASLVFGDC
jgi:3-oxoacyl-[acyl-carrier-protein] synthase II